MKTNGSQPAASGSNGAPSNFAPLAAAALDADSCMGFDDLDNAVLPCPSTASPRPETAISPAKKHWIAIELLDEQGKPVPGEDFRITLPDGSIVEDSLDSHGKARVNGIDPGSCGVCFPNLDKQIWTKESAA